MRNEIVSFEKFDSKYLIRVFKMYHAFDLIVYTVAKYLLNILLIFNRILFESFCHLWPPCEKFNTLTIWRLVCAREFYDFYRRRNYDVNFLLSFIYITKYDKIIELRNIIDKIISINKIEK